MPTIKKSTRKTAASKKPAPRVAAAVATNDDPLQAPSEPGPSKNTALKKHRPSPAMAAPLDVQKNEEFERSGSIGRSAHASVRTRKQGG